MTIQGSVRGALASALSGVAATTYDHVPEAVIPPAVVIIPDSPYLVPNLINKATTKVEVNLVISAVVAYNSNPGALDNIEQLIISILAALPAGYEVGNIERPTVTQIGASTVLVSDIRVTTYYTQGA